MKRTIQGQDQAIVAWKKIAQDKADEIKQIRKRCDEEVTRSLEREGKHERLLEEVHRESQNKSNTIAAFGSFGMGTIMQRGREYIDHMYNEEQKVKYLQKVDTRFRINDPSKLRGEQFNRAREMMKVFSKELPWVLPKRDYKNPLLVTRIVDQDLADLVRSIEGHHINDEDCWKSLVWWNEAPKPGFAIQGLVVAAVRDWVFASNCYTFGFNEVPLLEHYRQVVEAYGKTWNLHLYFFSMLNGVRW